MREIISFDEIEKYIKKIRRIKQNTIAFTNGCFDIIHRGHVMYLEKAKDSADILVVGLNSDDSVTRLKGPGRPYISQQDRAYVLSRLESVDVVCIFEQDTPYELIKLVRPDYLVKGEDYTVDQIVGKDIVASYGGEVYTIPLLQGHSTSKILSKLKTK